MADIVAKPISVLRQEADTIYEANTRGENTQVRVGGLFQDIVDWLAVNVPDTFVTLMTPLAEINNAQLGAPTNGKGLVYNNGHWQYGDFGGDGGGGTDTVDWDNITNKPDTFIPSTSYALDSDATNLYLKITEDQETTIISTIQWPSGGGGGGLPNNLVYYTMATYGEHFTNKQCISTKILDLGNLNSSGGHFLWVDPATSNLMFDEKPIVGSGIEWGENTAPANTLPNIVLNGNLYLQQDSNQYGGIFAANRIRISDYTLVGEENTYGYLGNRDIWVEDGELHFGNMQVTKTVNDVQMLNVEGEADDLHLEGNHLWLWNTVGEYKIGSGVELPASGGGGTGGSVSWDDITDKPDLDSLPYLADDTQYGSVLNYTDGTLSLLDQDGGELSSVYIGGGGGGDVSTGSWAAYFNGKSKTAGTTGYLHLNNDTLEIQTSIGGLTWTDLTTADASKIIDTSHIPTASGTIKGGIKTGYYNSSYPNRYAVDIDQTDAKAYVAVPVADDTHYGVIKINPAATLSTNRYPVNLDSNDVAYVEVSGTGGGWTPTGGTTSNPKVSKNDLATDVGDTYYNISSVTNLLAALDISLIKQLLSSHQYMFWIQPTKITTSGIGTQALYFFYNGPSISCRNGSLTNPVLYYTGSTVQICVSSGYYWTFDPSRTECAKVGIQYDSTDISSGSNLRQVLNNSIPGSYTFDSNPTKAVSLTELKITMYVGNTL